MRNRHLGAFTLLSPCQNNDDRNIGYVVVPNLSHCRREYPHSFVQYLDFDGRRSQDFAVPVEQAFVIGGQAYARRNETRHIEIREIAAGE